MFESSKMGNVVVAKVLESRISADISAVFKRNLIDDVISGNRLIVLDLSEVTFIDSSGLGALIGSLKVLGEGGELVLCGVRDSVVSMFKLTRMDKVFRIFKSREEAVAAVS